MKDNVYQATKLLIESSKESQELNKDKDKERNLNYLKSFCTIKVSTARQCGHTTAIVKLVSEFERSIVIVPNEHQERAMMKLLLESNNKSNFDLSNSYIKNINELNSLYGLQRVNGLNNINAIFVDISSMISNKKIDEIYKLALSYCQKDNYFYLIFVE